MEENTELAFWVEQYGDRLFRLANTYMNDLSLAEDCVQEALIKGFQKVTQLRNKDNALPWLMRIVINECKNRLRSRKNKEFVTSTLDVRYELGPESLVLNKLAVEHLHEAIMMLPDKYRLPIILHYFEDIPLEIIAQITKVNPGTVRTRIRRAREKLEKMIDGGDIDDFRRTDHSREIRV